jgi:membrane-associated HD superfamily phosphohydrolase
MSRVVKEIFFDVCTLTAHNMNRLQLLKQNLETLRQEYQGRIDTLFNNESKLNNKSSSTTLHESSWFTKLHKSKPIRRIHPPLMWGITVVSLTSVIGYRFYNQPQLSVGTISPVQMVAPKDGTFEDEKTTEEKRKEVRTGIIPVLQRDIQLTSELQGKLSETIEEIKKFRQEAGVFPFIKVELISLSIQQYLRNMPQQDWQLIQSAITNEKKGNNLELPPTSQQAITQLRNYGQSTSSQTLKGLLVTIEKSRQRYNQVQKEASSSQTSALTPELLTIFLNLDNSTWQTTDKTLKTTLNRILLQGASPRNS